VLIAIKEKMDINTIRQHTRGCLDKIFFNSAGSSLVPETVTNQMVSYLNEEALIGGYALAARHASAQAEFYTETAKLLNSKPENIAFCSSATDAYAKALSSVTFKNGDAIITTDDDYISNQLAFLSLQKEYQLEIVRAPNVEDGSLDMAAFESCITQHPTKLVAITHIPTSSGLVQPAAAIGEICNRLGVLYLLDACQSVGQLDIDVQKIGCDYLTATGRKFMRGPRGTGMLYVSDRVLNAGLVPRIFDMQAARWTGPDTYELTNTAGRFEYFETSIAGKLGLMQAIKYANEIGMANIEAYNKELMQHFRQAMAEVKGLTLHDKGTQLSNILTFTIENKSVDELMKLLSNNQVYYSVSFKDFALIDFSKKNIDRAIRFSPHYFNTTEECEKVVAILSS
jgi:cysteine desulfurase/selenocysteine lyase